MFSGLICGVDEAGRGPLAGSVFAAAVILDPHRPIDGLADSKQLSEKKRQHLALQIKETALAWSIQEASVEEIDQINILHASMLAMKRAILAISPLPDTIRIDGNRCPDGFDDCNIIAIVKGDQSVPAISAASILAKTARDENLVALDKVFPEYGFAKHKGYPTKFHLEQLLRYGPSAVHRKSFGPVTRALKQMP